MSDLAQQLRKRKDQAVGTTQRSVHVKPSLLFDGREAARIETTAIHLLALGGLEQLKKLEPRLKSFEATLVIFYAEIAAQLIFGFVLGSQIVISVSITNISTSITELTII
jgi:hypothetical protein